MTAALATQQTLRIIEGGAVDAPQAMVLDDGEKYTLTIDPARLQAIFSADNGLTPIIDAIREKARIEWPDVTTAKGRAEIKSLAHKVTRSKTYLDGIGKDMVADLKDLPRRIDANRKMLRDELDSLAEETRKPLTDYEAHTKGITDRLNAIDAMPTLYGPSTSEEIAGQIAALENEPMTPEAWEEFLPEAIKITERTRLILKGMFETKAKAEGEAEELARLRAQAAERERKDAETARIKEAAETARKEAEQRAESERQAALGREAEANRQATLARQQAEESERRRVESEARAAQDAIDAKLRADDAAEKARAQAIEEERARHEEDARIAAEAQAARDADKAHTRQINSEVAEDIETALWGKELANATEVARAVTIAIIKSQVRHTAITY